MFDNILNITNGDCTVKVMREAGIKGEYLPWRDVLHEGPVPTGITQSELNKVRARFISEQGWDEYENVVDWFNYRDSMLELANTYDEVVLWFEHDLYDQLQLIQVLTLLAEKDMAGVPLNLICVADYLGPMQPETILKLTDNKQPVIDEHYEIAIKAWKAFTSFDPIQIYNLLAKNLSPFAFLKEALYRLMQQYPSVENGLNRTERQILQAIKSGCKIPYEIFAHNQDADEIKFMGDTTFWYYMKSLSSGIMPLVKTESGEKFKLPEKFESQKAFNAQQLVITDIGKLVLENKADWLDYYSIDRCYGGVRIYEENIWRWSDDTGSLCR